MMNEDFFCDLTALFWKYYIMEPTKAHFEEMFSYLSDNLVMIGTGKHEFYTDIEQIMENLSGNLIEAESIKLHVLDEWYECQKISQDVYLVYGGIWVRQHEQEGMESLIEMDTRFSLVYRVKDEKCELLHIHHSIPYTEQKNGEYYPKTLSEKAKEALLLAKMYEAKAELDLMTEIYNNVSFKHHVIEKMKSCDGGAMYVFDLDYFKQVNDTYGHAKGDELLKLFASILKRYFDEKAIIGRMGGDEFAVFEFGLQDKERSIKIIKLMRNDFNYASHRILCECMASFSVGIAFVKKSPSAYSDLYSNADSALYRAKELGRKNYYWYDESEFTG